MECVIKITRGPEEGQEFHCTAVETVIGRSPRSQLRLSSPTVSYEHAVITRAGSEFFLENLSATGTFLREERLSGKIRLRTKDVFRIGQDTAFRIEALPPAPGSGGKKRGLLIAVVLFFLLFLIVVIVDPFSPKIDATNWKTAYRQIDDWTQQQTAAGNLRPEALQLLHDAWRLESAGNRTESSQDWVRLTVLLDHEEDRMHFKDAAAADHHALDRLLKPEPNAPAPTNDQMAAALLQFVTRMADKK